jgi:catechol 2,3-dioxygenase-like lactoylglutathione lyase family enzyme
MKSVLGIHHVTAIAGDPQANVDFYCGVLGLRLLKQTVNFDDPATYHFYFGVGLGAPGSIITFFPWGAQGMLGRRGVRQVAVTAFSISDGAMGYWVERLQKFNVNCKGPFTRFDEEVLSLSDPDGVELELVAAAHDARPAWEGGAVPAAHAIRGFYHVALAEEGYERTAGLLTTTLGFRPLRESGNRFRYEAGEGGPGALVDLLCLPDAPPGRMGVGAVHHVAWRAENDASQINMRSELARLGYNVTPVIDRNYFRSIYFREPGQVLFEIATDPPGFTVDEPPEELGRNLKLPPWLEADRQTIEQALPPINPPKI